MNVLRMCPIRGLALSLAAALVAVACSSSASDITEVAESTTTTTAAPATTEEDGETTDVETSDAPSNDGELTDGDPQTMPDPLFQAELQLFWEYVVGDHVGLIESDLGYSPVLLEPGTYDTDSMFTPMRFTVAEHTRLIVERHTFMDLVDQSANQLWDVPIMHWLRPHKLTDPADTAEGPPDWPGFVEGWDFDAWFAAHPAIDVERTDLSISGIESVRYDISFDGFADVGWDCGGALCVPLMLQYGPGPFDLVSEELYRMWVIPQGDFHPIVAVAVVDASAGWGDFGDRVDGIIESVELGEPQPVGVAENVWESGVDWFVPAGVVQFPILGGVEFEMPKEYFVRQENNWSYIDMVDEDFDIFPPNVEIAGALQAIDGSPIESAEQLADLMVERASATRLPDAEIAGRPAIVVEMLGVQPNLPIFRHVALPDSAAPHLGSWFTQDFVQLWAVDTDNGVLIVTAEADSAEALDVALGLHETVRESLVIFE